MSNQNGKEEVLYDKEVKLAGESVHVRKLTLLSRLIEEVCDCISDIWFDYQKEIVDPACAVYVIPVLGGETPIGWSVQVYLPVEVDKRIDPNVEEYEWVPFAITREFRTGHMIYARGTTDITHAVKHGPDNTINFFKWLKSQMEQAMSAIK